MTCHSMLALSMKWEYLATERRQVLLPVQGIRSGTSSRRRFAAHRLIPGERRFEHAVAVGNGWQAALKGLDPFGWQFGFDTDVLAAYRLCVDRCAVLGEHAKYAAHTGWGGVDLYVGHRFANLRAGVVQSLHQYRRRQLAEVGGGT